MKHLYKLRMVIIGQTEEPTIEFWEKDLIYQGFKHMPYSTGCKTPLSNFEAELNYKDMSNPTVIVSFPLKDDMNHRALLHELLHHVILCYVSMQI